MRVHETVKIHCHIASEKWISKEKRWKFNYEKQHQKRLEKMFKKTELMKEKFYD